MRRIGGNALDIEGVFVLAHWWIDDTLCFGKPVRVTWILRAYDEDLRELEALVEVLEVNHIELQSSKGYQHGGG